MRPGRQACAEDSGWLESVGVVKVPGIPRSNKWQKASQKFQKAAPSITNLVPEILDNAGLSLAKMSHPILCPASAARIQSFSCCKKEHFYTCPHVFASRLGIWGDSSGRGPPSCFGLLFLGAQAQSPRSNQGYTGEPAKMLLVKSVVAGWGHRASRGLGVGSSEGSQLERASLEGHEPTSSKKIL